MAAYEAEMGEEAVPGLVEDDIEMELNDEPRVYIVDEDEDELLPGTSEDVSKNLTHVWIGKQKSM